MKARALLVAYLRERTPSYVFGILIMILTGVLAMSIPRLIGTITDGLASQQQTPAEIGQLLLLMLGVVAAVFGLKFAWRYLLIGNSRAVEVYFRSHLFRHLQSLPLGFYHERKTGDLVAYAINDIQAIRFALGPALLQSLDGTSLAIISIIFMSGTVNPSLTLFTLLPIPIAVLIMVKVAPLIRERYRVVQESYAAISEKVQENLSGIRVIKAFAQEEAEVANFAIHNRRRMDAQIALTRVSALVGPAIQVCFGLSFLIFLVLGSRLVISRAISIGDFVAFNLYILAIISPVANLSRIIEFWQKGIASYRRLAELFELEPAPGLRGGPSGLGLRGGISIRHLDFRYPNAPRPALRDINFELAPGQTLGVIGASGSGKTTLANLLLRLHPVAQGSILIDGVDINDLPIDRLRENIGYVPQDHFLFSTTIRRNIEFFRPDYSEEEIEDATRQSDIHDSITNFPEGYETLVGERGVTLSGGQKQRLSLARALVKEPDILILDDCLSAVDARTEAQILANIRNVLQGRTGVIISHRVATVRQADQIIVLDEGRIVEWGRHETLLALGGRYAGLFAHQGKNQ